MNKLNLILGFTLISVGYIRSMENSAFAEIQNKEQGDWNQLPQDCWLEICKLVIGDEQTNEERFQNYHSLALTNKALNELIKKDEIQNRLKKYVYKEVEDLSHWYATKNQQSICGGKFVSVCSTGAMAAKVYDQKCDIPDIELAIQNGKFAYVHFYLKNNPEKLNAAANDLGDTILHLATCYGFLNHRIFDFVLSKKPDVNTQNNAKETPLHHAVLCRNLDDSYRFKKLAKIGANIYIKNTRSKSPLELLYEFAPFGESAFIWPLINEIVPQEHKDQLKTKRLWTFKHLEQLHIKFGPR